MTSQSLHDMVRAAIQEELRQVVRSEFAALASSPEPTPRRRSSQNLARNGRRAWSDRDKQALLDDIGDGMTVDEAAQKYGRTKKAIIDRLYHPVHGLLAPPHFQ